MSFNWTGCVPAAPPAPRTSAAVRWHGVAVLWRRVLTVVVALATVTGITAGDAMAAPSRPAAVGDEILRADQPVPKTCVQ